jgi:hypothetical protein
MEKNMKHIDNLFKEEIGGFADAPPPMVWDALEKRLDERKRRVLPYRWFWYFTAISFIVVTGATIALKMGNNTKQLASATAKNTEAVAANLPVPAPTVSANTPNTIAKQNNQKTASPSITPTTTKTATTTNKKHNSAIVKKRTTNKHTKTNTTAIATTTSASTDEEYTGQPVAANKPTPSSTYNEDEDPYYAATNQPAGESTYEQSREAMIVQSEGYAVGRPSSTASRTKERLAVNTLKAANSTETQLATTEKTVTVRHKKTSTKHKLHHETNRTATTSATVAAAGTTQTTKTWAATAVATTPREKHTTNVSRPVATATSAPPKNVAAPAVTKDAPKPISEKLATNAARAINTPANAPALLAAKANAPVSKPAKAINNPAPEKQTGKKSITQNTRNTKPTQSPTPAVIAVAEKATPLAKTTGSTTKHTATVKEQKQTANIEQPATKKAEQKQERNIPVSAAIASKNINTPAAKKILRAEIAQVIPTTAKSGPKSTPAVKQVTTSAIASVATHITTEPTKNIATAAKEIKATTAVSVKAPVNNKTKTAATQKATTTEASNNNILAAAPATTLAPAKQHKKAATQKEENTRVAKAQPVTPKATIKTTAVAGAPLAVATPANIPAKATVAKKQAEKPASQEPAVATTKPVSKKQAAGKQPASHEPATAGLAIANNSTPKTGSKTAAKKATGTTPSATNNFNSAAQKTLKPSYSLFDGVEEILAASNVVTTPAAAPQEEAPIRTFKEEPKVLPALPIANAAASKAEEKSVDSPVIAPPAHLRKFELGIKGGMEGSASVNAGRKAVVSPYLSYRLTNKLSLMVQPAVKLSNLQDRKIDGTQSYYKANNDAQCVLVDSAFAYIVPYGPVWLRTYKYTQTYDSIVKTYSVGGNYFEFELPVLAKYALTKSLSAYGGVNVGFSKAIQIKENTFESGPITKEDTRPVFSPLNQPARAPLPVSAVLNYSGTPISQYTPMYPAPDGNIVRLGYMLGFSYEYKKRWMLDALVQQGFAKSNVQGGYNINTALSLPYVRLTVGYKLIH